MRIDTVAPRFADAGLIANLGVGELVGGAVSVVAVGDGELLVVKLMDVDRGDDVLFVEMRAVSEADAAVGVDVHPASTQMPSTAAPAPRVIRVVRMDDLRSSGSDCREPQESGRLAGPSGWTTSR